MSYNAIQLLRCDLNMSTENMSQELPIIQKTYDLICWYVPIIDNLPRNHRFTLGERVVNGLYEFLEELVLARYSGEKLKRLEPLNGRLDVLRYQTRLLVQLADLGTRRYEYVNGLLREIGMELGGWIKHLKKGPR